MYSLKKAFCFLVVAALFVCSAGCSGIHDGAVNVMGSTSIQPFAEALSEVYLSDNPEDNVEVQGGGSTAGLQAVRNGLADICMCSRSLSESEAEFFTSQVIAQDGFAIVVNPNNPVENLSMKELQLIFAGAIDNWKQVGGEDYPIRPITREEGSGTRESFVQLVMGTEKISRKALTQESNGAVRELVKGDKAAIGYMSLNMTGPELKKVKVDQVAPTPESVQSGQYRLVRPFYFVTLGALRPEAEPFFDFVLSDEGQTILESEGLVRNP